MLSINDVPLVFTDLLSYFDLLLGIIIFILPTYRDNILSFYILTNCSAFNLN